MDQNRPAEQTQGPVISGSAKKQKSRSQTEEEVRSLGWWYQHFELPSGVWTGHGGASSYRPETRWNLFELIRSKGPLWKDCSGRGRQRGFLFIQMLLRGAQRCVLVEPFTEFARQAEYAAAEFGVDLEIVNEDVHVYCLSNVERFDYVLFLGLFYHLKYPVLVLDRLAEMTRERMFFQSHLLGSAGDTYKDQSNYEIDTPLLENPYFPRLLFIEKLYNRDPTVWWIPNYTALEPLLRSAGLKAIARPDPELVVAEPEYYFGKVEYEKLIFPRYGKRDGAIHPGPQNVAPDLWRELIREARA